MKDIGYKLVVLRKEDIALYRNYLFGGAEEQFEQPNVHVVGALDGDTLIGVCCFREGDIPAILSVSVSQDYQGKGVGSALVDFVAGVLIDNGLSSMEAILFGGNDEIDELEYFLYRCGFEREEDRPDIEVSLSSVLEVPEFQKLNKGKHTFAHVRFLSELLSQEKKELGELLRSNSPYQSFPEKNLVPELSTCYEEDGRIMGCSLVGEDDGILILQYVFLHKNCKNRVVLLYMLAQTLFAMVDKRGGEKMIRILGASDSSEDILTYFFGEEAESQRLNRYICEFQKAGEADVEAITDPEPLAEGIEGGALSRNPGFTAVTNADYICRDCIYRLVGSPPLVCHKYSMKPDEVLTIGQCAYYRKELEG